MRRGRHDQLVVDVKPSKRPSWLTAEAYADLPASLTVRECRVRVGQPGFRTRVLVVATTLLDVEAFTKDDLAQLFRGRIRHPDHATITLSGWLRVVMNTEGQSRAMRNAAFLD